MSAVTAPSNTPDLAALPLIDDELDLLASLVPLAGARIIEPGCGAARLARSLLARFEDAEVVGLEVDERQHAKNLAAPHPRLRFLCAGAQAIPFEPASFDGAMMLKSLHHVPLDLMDQALAEIARVVRPGGWFYACEPIYGGALNELVRLYNEERTVRAAAQSALDRAVAGGQWTPVAEHRFAMPVHFASFDEFERRMMWPTFADHRIDETIRAAVRARYEPHQGPDGAAFQRPLHARLLCRAQP